MFHHNTKPVGVWVSGDDDVAIIFLATFKASLNASSNSGFGYSQVVKEGSGLTCVALKVKPL